MATVAVRASKPAPRPEPARRRRHPSPRGQAASRPVLGPACIPVLLIDDSVAFLHAAREVLQGAQPAFGVHTVTSGMEALAFLERRPPFSAAPQPAFIILDFRLPDVTAPALLQRIAVSEELRRIPVLVLSQAAWAEDEAAARTAGARDYHVKPSRVRSLRAIVVDFWRRYVDAGYDTPR
jgi:CheY-like chemotaxis protein